EVSAAPPREPKQQPGRSDNARQHERPFLPLLLHEPCASPKLSLRLSPKLGAGPAAAPLPSCPEAWPLPLPIDIQVSPFDLRRTAGQSSPEGGERMGEAAVP